MITLNKIDSYHYNGIRRFNIYNKNDIQVDVFNINGTIINLNQDNNFCSILDKNRYDTYDRTKCFQYIDYHNLTDEMR